MTPQDQELIEKVKAGDKEAFTQIFDKYSDNILGYLYRYVGDYQTAQDLTIETFLNVYNNLARYEEMGTFSSWLYKIATNCAKMELRKKSRRRETSLEEYVDEAEGTSLADTIADESAPAPDREAAERDSKEYLYKFVERLDRKYKDAFLLCDVEGMSQEEAARVLNSNVKTIGTRLVRARRMLYDILKREGLEL